MQNTPLGVFRWDDVLPYRWPFASPGDIHFWIYDDVIDNGILGLHLNQYSQRFCGAFILVPFIYYMRQRVTCKGTSEEQVKQKKAGVRLCNAKKDLTKANSTVVFFYVLWVEWSLNSCKFQVSNNYFLFSKKLLRETRINLLVDYSNKIHMHETFVHMHGLWKTVKCVISEPILQPWSKRLGTLEEIIHKDALC